MERTGLCQISEEELKNNPSINIDWVACLYMFVQMHSDKCDDVAPFKKRKWD